MIPRIFRAAEDGRGRCGAVCVGAAVREGDELRECVRAMRAFEEGGVADLLLRLLCTCTLGGYLGAP